MKVNALSQKKQLEKCQFVTTYALIKIYEENPERIYKGLGKEVEKM